MSTETRPDASKIFAIDRPSPSLMTYYVIASFMAGPFFFIPMIPLYFRYHTMRYRFDEEGISMRWGILFRREINLTYARIQDIHLRSNFVERWLNLARIEVQTASGSSGAELTLEGLLEFAAIRDFLYDRMRGVAVGAEAGLKATGGSSAGSLDESTVDQLTDALNEVAAEIKAVRAAIEAGHD